MAYKEQNDENSNLFKEFYDAVCHKNSYEIKICNKIIASPGTAAAADHADTELIGQTR